MSFCCDRMREAVEYRCKEHPDPSDCPDNLISYAEAAKAFGLIVHDGGHSYVQIDYCPWCGPRLGGH